MITRLLTPLGITLKNANAASRRAILLAIVVLSCKVDIVTAGNLEIQCSCRRAVVY
jgi:hypothetical protein